MLHCALLVVFGLQDRTTTYPQYCTLLLPSDDNMMIGIIIDCILTRTRTAFKILETRMHKTGGVFLLLFFNYCYNHFIFIRIHVFQKHSIERPLYSYFLKSRKSRWHSRFVLCFACCNVNRHFHHQPKYCTVKKS